MTEANHGIAFWKFPLSLKLAVIWIFIDSAMGFYSLIKEFISDSRIDVVSLVMELAFLGLAIGLLQKKDNSRLGMIFWLICKTLFRFALLINIALIPYDWSFRLDFIIKQYPLDNFYGAVTLAFVVLVDIGAIFILLRPSTKALFTPPPAPVLAPQEPA